MPWVMHGDGLKLVGEQHYDAEEIRGLIGELRKSSNQPKRVCDGFEKVVATGMAPKELIWRLSKWCDWDNPAQFVAQSIAGKLFFGHICRRLLDQENRRINVPRRAAQDYEDWRKVVVGGRSANGIKPSGTTGGRLVPW